MKNEARQAAAYIRERTRVKPSIGIILGTGLGRLARHLRGAGSIDYATIPNFPIATVETHKGRIIMGTLRGKSVMTMQGRFHYYEGYSAKEIALPVLVMKLLGVKTLVDHLW